MLRRHAKSSIICVTEERDLRIQMSRASIFIVIRMKKKTLFLIFQIYATDLIVAMFLVDDSLESAN